MAVTDINPNSDSPLSVILLSPSAMSSIHKVARQRLASLLAL